MRERLALLSALCTAAVAACAGNGAQAGRTGERVDGAADVNAAACPTERDSPAGKVHEEAFLRSDPIKTHSVTITLRDRLPAVPPCPGDDGYEARCQERDLALETRQAANLAHIECVLMDIGATRAGGVLSAAWYERPRFLTSGSPAPVVLAYDLPLHWERIERAASHSLVETIAPSAGLIPFLGLSAPPPPAECPGSSDAVEAKLTGAEAIRGQGRRPVILEVRDEGLLPPPIACPDGSVCGPRTGRDWERTLLNTRHLTCLNRWIDASVKETPARVSYLAKRGSLATPPLPPLGQPAATIKAYGLGVTWDELVKIAAHPYLERAWTAPDLQLEPMPPTGCPTNLSAPIPMKECSDQTESGAGKISASARTRLQMSAGVQRVVVSVRGGATICPLPDCPGPCPERDQIQERWKTENLAAQRCVRETITRLGGSASTDSFWLVNAFEAYLEWPQIEQLATHPDVQQIEPAMGGERPAASSNRP